MIAPKARRTKKSSELTASKISERPAQEEDRIITETRGRQDREMEGKGKGRGEERRGIGTHPFTSDPSGIKHSGLAGGRLAKILLGEEEEGTYTPEQKR